MLKIIIMFILRLLLGLRYRISVKNLDQIRAKGHGGILFLANHPALIDPGILNMLLCTPFAPRALADQKQLRIPFVKYFLQMYNPITLPDLKEVLSKSDKETVLKQLQLVSEVLNQRGNILLYPSGRIYRGRYEDLRSNSSVEIILKNCPDIRLVLVRTSGLWGSSFSWGYSEFPGLFKFAKKYCAALFANLLFLMPRRRIEIDFCEPADFPRGADRKTINRYLENYYNASAPPNTQVPYYFFQGRQAKIVPEPQLKNSGLDLANVPAGISARVLEKLTEITSVKVISPADSLAGDLGLDSLALVDLTVWVESEFGFTLDSLEHLQTVADLILAACGEVSGAGKFQFKAVPDSWFADSGSALLTVYPGNTIAAAFLNQALANPRQVLIADQLTGVKTNRDLLTGVFILSEVIRRYSDEKIGIMLPATVAATVAYLSVMFAGRTPVMVNWTAGEAVLKYSLELVDCKKVLTSKKLLEKLQKQGSDYFNCGVEWLYLEEIGAALSFPAKLSGLLKSRLLPGLLKNRRISATAAILFTSGSEAKPKAVPLTHANFLTNIRDYLSVVNLSMNNRLIGMLPPFHSFGLSCAMILPLVTGARIVYHANPTEGAILGELISRYRVSVLFGTPTFVNGILRASTPEKLQSVRLLVTGAEKCSDAVYQKISAVCPRAVMCEGYGITECSPVVSLNDPAAPVRGTVGKILSGLEYRLLHPETFKEVPLGEQGLLVLRGASIFGGYLNYNGKSPFISFQGQEWYNTGDLVVENADQVLTFTGRLKRFVKIGGEMISLAALEEVLNRTYPPTEEGPVLAVEAASPDENPELVLFITQKAERETVNRLLRQGGLSGLCSIRRIIMLETIPLLGSGKTDYQRLKELL